MAHRSEPIFGTVDLRTCTTYMVVCTRPLAHQDQSRLVYWGCAATSADGAGQGRRQGGQAGVVYMFGGPSGDAQRTLRALLCRGFYVRNKKCVNTGINRSRLQLMGRPPVDIRTGRTRVLALNYVQ